MRSRRAGESEKWECWLASGGVVLGADQAWSGFTRMEDEFMPRIRVEALQVGVTVAADVKNIDGMLVIPKGVTLGERQIGILQAWGVAEVEVEAGEGDENQTDLLGKLPPETLARLTEETKAPFWEADESNPVYAEIFKELLLRRARKLAEH